MHVIMLGVAAAVLSFVSPALASDDAAAQAAPTTNKDLHSISQGIDDSVQVNQSVEQCWAKWLHDEDLKEGKNETNGHMILVSQFSEAVQAAPGSGKWLSARKGAFQSVEIRARAAMAETMRTLIKSDRSLAAAFNENDAPPSLNDAGRALSIADKVNVLTDKALDNEIGKYDPDWNKKPLAEKKESVAKLESHIQGHISAEAELFAAGSFTAVQCEGPSKEDGDKYSVLVGLIWSPKLASIAESIWNPAFKIASEIPDSPLSAQFDAFSAVNPDWMAYTMGARVFTNDKGERVVVGFGVVSQTSSAALDKRHAGLDAFSAIQRFVGEKIVSSRDAADSLASRELADGTVQSFDSSIFNEKIALQSKDLLLKGATEVLSWRGEHPWGQSKMQVVAFAWSPSWAGDSEQTFKVMQSIEKRMSNKGGVPQSPVATKDAFHGAGAAVPARAGAASHTRNF